MPPTARPVIERLLEKIEFADDGCWLWTAAKTTGGYGLIKSGPGMQCAHRVLYEIAVGPIPADLQLDHLCRVRRCVNPEHLEPVTQAENMRRGEGPAGRWRDTHCKRGHEFTPENTWVHDDVRGHWRECRTCRNAATRRFHERRREG